MRIASLLAAALLACAGPAFAQATDAPPQGEGNATKKYPDGTPFQAGRPMMTARPAGDKAILRTVADAMGFIRGIGPQESTDILNRLLWRGSGTMSDVKGKSFEVKRYTYGLSLQQNAAREDIERTGAERLVWVVAGERAWDESEPGVGGRYVDSQAKARRLRLYRTPFGFTRALLKADPATVKITDPGPGGKVTVALPIEGVATTAVLDSDYRPQAIAMTVGGEKLQSAYTDYRDLSEYGVMFPTHVVEMVNGKTVLDLNINDGRVATYVVFPPPAAPEGR